jgi:small subunit ribosomal protein S13
LARIAGVNIPLNKRVEIGLTYIYGVGQPTSNELLAELGISPDTYVRDLTDDEVAKLRDIIDATHRRGRPAPRALAGHQAPDGDRLLPRHAPPRGLPVRGQNTKTNARTRKGPKRMSGRRQEEGGKK